MEFFVPFCAKLIFLFVSKECLRADAISTLLWLSIHFLYYTAAAQLNKVLFENITVARSYHLNAG